MWGWSGMARATADMMLHRRASLWAWLMQYGYCGWGKCKCGAFAYLGGRSYEGKKCRACVMGGKR